MFLSTFTACTCKSQLVLFNMSQIQNVSVSHQAIQFDSKIFNVVDSSNIDAFFREPSADELTKASELRIQEIIDYLQQRTTEEIENWSGGTDTAQSPRGETTSSDSTSYLESKALFHEGEMVSSPVSILQASIAEPNETADARPGDNDHAKPLPWCSPPRHARSVRQAVITAASPNPLSLPDKPSFQSFIKRVAKTPPPPTTHVRDFAFVQKHQPSLPSVTLQSTPAKALAVRKFVELARKVQSSRAPKVGLRRSQTEELAPVATINDEEENAGDSSRGPRSRPRSFSSPPVKDMRAPDHIKFMKRKPLPTDSPLLIPVTQHPAFAMLGKENVKPLGDDQKTKKRDSKLEAKELDRLEVTLPLPPTLSTKLKSV